MISVFQHTSLKSVCVNYFWGERGEFLNQHSITLLSCSLSESVGCACWPCSVQLSVSNYCTKSYEGHQFRTYAQLTDFYTLWMLIKSLKVGNKSVNFCVSKCWGQRGHYILEKVHKEVCFLCVVSLEVSWSFFRLEYLSGWVIKWSALERLINLTVMQGRLPLVSPSACLTGTPGTRHCHASDAGYSPGRFCVQRMVLGLLGELTCSPYRHTRSLPCSCS